jgi:hypothetical protein
MKIDGVKHLSSADNTSSLSSNMAYSLNGIIFGNNSRVHVMAVVLVTTNFMNVVMMVNTSLPFTFLTEETFFDAVGINLQDHPDDHCFVEIVDSRSKAYASRAHFLDVNVLGTNV